MRTQLLNLFIGLACTAAAQSFTHSLSVFSPSSGLQALPLSPKLRNIASTNLSDVRLYDKDSTEIPFFLVHESFSYSSARFKEYKISDREIKKGYSSFVVENPNSEKIQNIVLCVANSDAVKICDVSGSDDGKQWFSVSDGIWMHHLYDDNSVEAYRTLIFPAVNYKRIKILINDRFSLPYNIKKAGYFEGAIGAGQLNELKPAVFDYSNDKQKKVSRALVKFPDSAIIDQVKFTVKAPNLYKRQARLFVRRTITEKGREKEVTVPLLEFELNSEKPNTFNLSGVRYKTLELEISNEDNPPLEFESIAFRQLQSWLVADFKGASMYRLYAGNKSLKAPVYDIENFRNKITQFLPSLDAGELMSIPVKEASVIQPEKRKLWQEPWLLWLCIAVASFMLFLFSLRILRDLKNAR